MFWVNAAYTCETDMPCTESTPGRRWFALHHHPLSNGPVPLFDRAKVVREMCENILKLKKPISSNPRPNKF